MELLVIPEDCSFVLFDIPYEVWFIWEDEVEIVEVELDRVVCGWLDGPLTSHRLFLVVAEWEGDNDVLVSLFFSLSTVLAINSCWEDVLDDDYSFLLISSYTTGISHISLENILKLEFKNAKVETGENTLPVTEDNLILPCGIYGKVTKN